MATRISNSDLQATVDRINRITKSPPTYSTRSILDGQFLTNVGNYHLDWAYGGVTLCRVYNTMGAVTNVLSIGHVKKAELYRLMHAFIKGLEAAEQRT